MRNITTVTMTAVRNSVSDEQQEAHRAALVALLDLALERALLGGAAQRVAPMALERDLLDEGPLPVGEALTHLHAVTRVLGSYGRLALGALVDVDEAEVVLGDLAAPAARSIFPST